MLLNAIARHIATKHMKLHHWVRAIKTIPGLVEKGTMYMIRDVNTFGPIAGSIKVMNNDGMEVSVWSTDFEIL